MTIREDIVRTMQKWIDERENVSIISPTAVASAAMREFREENDGLEPHIEYTSLEQFKQIARHVLAHRFEDDGEDNPVYQDQGSLFSGLLQDRYPLPRQRGIEPQYKLRSLLTSDERTWNAELLRKGALARLAHADALEAEGRERGETV